jgi:hypothetical protein
MESLVLQSFKARINSVEFDDYQLYMTTDRILEEIDDKFGTIYTDEFIKDLADVIQLYFFKVDKLIVSELEWNMLNNIEDAETFRDIQFTDYYINHINEQIKDGSYLK